MKRDYRRELLDIFLMISLLLISGLATKIFRSAEFSLALFIIAIMYLSVTRQILSKHFLLVCFVWIVYVILSYIKFFGDNYFWPLPLLFNLTIAFAVVQYYKDRFFENLTRAIFWLSLWSLILFGWQITSFSSISGIWERFDISQKLFNKPFTKYAHTFLYTIHQFYDVSKGAPRNSGFAWEPGAYSGFLVIAIYFQLLIDQFEISKRKFRYMIFFLALVSTQSTTGLFAAMTILVAYAMRGRFMQKPITYIILIVSLGTLIVISDSHILKIEDQLSTDIMSAVIAADRNEFEGGLGRFQSIYILAIDFINNPILGLGEDADNSWIISNGFFATPTSGIGNMFATYGLFLMLPYLYYLKKSSNLFCIFYSSEIKYVFFIIVLIIGFSFGILLTPFFLALSMFSLFAPRSAMQIPLKALNHEK